MYQRIQEVGRGAGWVIALTIGLLAVSCNDGSSSQELEARIAELEAKHEQQQGAIATVAFAATTPRGTVFDSPLKQFFDSPEFWENVVVDSGSCLSRCAQKRTEGVLACAQAPIDAGCIFVQAAGPITTDDCATECVNQSVPPIP